MEKLNTAWNFGNTGLKIAVILILLGCFWENGLSQAEQPFLSEEIISGIDIRIDGVKGDTGMWETTARDLIPLGKGDVYSPQKVLETIGLLSESRLFSHIEVPDPQKTADGRTLVFLLTPFGRVKDILVEGAFPVFKKEVLRVMTLYTGDGFSEDRLDEQKSRVEALFKKRGYIDPNVMVSAQRDPGDGHTIVQVRIEKGEFYRIRTVSVEGNNRFSDTRLKLRTKTWKSSLLFGSATRFVKKDLDADVKNLVRFYRSKGFAEVTVSAKAPKNDRTKTVDVLFHIMEGPFYTIGFEGNNRFWDRTLKREMTLSKDGNKNDFAVRKGARNIQKKYNRIGYLDAKIQTRINETKAEKKSVRDVTLEINEGSPTLVSKIIIKGNHGLDEKRIREQMLTQPPGFWVDGGYYPKTLDEDITAIRALYLKEGYANARIQKKITISDPPSKNGENLKFLEIELTVDEGPRTRVGTVKFQGLSVMNPESAMKVIALQPGQVFRDYMIESDENALKKYISEMGYPNIQVKGTVSFNEDRSLADIAYGVDEGTFVTVGQIYYTGNFRTKEKILNNEMALSPGEPLSLTKLLESRQNMMNMNALDSVRFRTLGLKEKFEEVDLVLEVEEKKPYFFEVGAGYDTERHFYINSTVGDHNFLGRNLNLETSAEVSQIGYKGIISLMEPRFFSTRISSTTKLAAEKQEAFNTDFGIQTYSLSQSFYQQFLEKKLTANLGFRYEYREQYLTDTTGSTTEVSQVYDPRTIFVTSPSLIYRTTDSFVRPTKGVFSAVYTDISKGVDNTLDDYVKYRFDTRYYYTLFEPLTVAIRGRYGVIQPYGGNETIPEDQLFFLGGTSTVRGFDENMLAFDDSGNAVGGREAILGSLEARYDLGLNVEGALFYDMGRLRKTSESISSQDFRSSVGVGLRYMTPIGPIGLLYGWKLDPLPGESSGSLHFSMGYTF
ncbi:outer membrane protein assembly factor BamA [Desulfobacula sp.]|uniref:outer membrane protein assembly factor BamA n=1 Tax=Desulfobacula sp. TaxID=2593537 RepID=UPI002630A3B9|nr:outer membrane protein assembly factor BamA [Desulfobacula sp.]